MPDRIITSYIIMHQETFWLLLRSVFKRMFNHSASMRPNVLNWQWQERRHVLNSALKAWLGKQKHHWLDWTQANTRELRSSSPATQNTNVWGWTNEVWRHTIGLCGCLPWEALPGGQRFLILHQQDMSEWVRLFVQPRLSPTSLTLHLAKCCLWPTAVP